MYRHFDPELLGLTVNKSDSVGIAQSALKDVFDVFLLPENDS